MRLCMLCARHLDNPAIPFSCVGVSERCMMCNTLRELTLVAEEKAVSYAPKSVQEAWDHASEAIEKGDIDAILLDYTEVSETESVIRDAFNMDVASYVYLQTLLRRFIYNRQDSIIRLYDHSEGKLTEVKGLADIRSLLTRFMMLMTDCSSAMEPFEKVTEDPRHGFLLWDCPDSGVISASSTSLYRSPDFKIMVEVCRSHYNATPRSGLLNVILTQPSRLALSLAEYRVDEVCEGRRKIQPGTYY